MGDRFQLYYTTLSVIVAVLDYYNFINLKYVGKAATMLVLSMDFFEKNKKADSKFLDYFTKALLIYSLLEITSLITSNIDSEGFMILLSIILLFLGVENTPWFSNSAGKSNSIIFQAILRTTAQIFLLNALAFAIKRSNRKVNSFQSAALYIPFLVYGVGFLYYIYPNLDEGMRLYVVFFAILDTIMGVIAASRYFYTNSASFYYVFIGTILLISAQSMTSLAEFSGFGGPCIRFAVILKFFAAHYLIGTGGHKESEHDSSPTKKEE